METPTYIYTLSDPRDMIVRYVGITKTPDRRLRQHIATKQNVKKCEWVNRLLLDGITPVMTIIETVFDNTVFDREAYWISYYNENGLPLFNVIMHATEFDYSSEKQRQRALRKWERQRQLKKTCPSCGVEFKARRITAKFCSDKCKMRFHRLVEG